MGPGSEACLDAVCCCYGNIFIVRIYTLICGRLNSLIILSSPFNLIFVLSFEVQPACDVVCALLPPMCQGTSLSRHGTWYFQGSCLDMFRYA